MYHSSLTIINTIIDHLPQFRQRRGDSDPNSQHRECGETRTPQRAEHSRDFSFNFAQVKW